MGTCKVKNNGACIVMIVYGVGKGFGRSKKELPSHDVNKGVLITLLLNVQAGHMQGKKDGGKSESKYNAIGEVVGSNDNGDNKDDNEGIASRHAMQMFQGVPVKGGDADGDHDGGERSKGYLYHQVVE